MIVVDKRNGDISGQSEDAHENDSGKRDASEAELSQSEEAMAHSTDSGQISDETHASSSQLEFENHDSIENPRSEDIDQIVSAAESSLDYSGDERSAEVAGSSTGKTGRWLSRFAILLALAAASVSGFAGWQWYQLRQTPPLISQEELSRSRNRIATLETQVGALKETMARVEGGLAARPDVADILSRHGKSIGALESRVESMNYEALHHDLMALKEGFQSQQTTVADLRSIVGPGQLRWVITDVEELLSFANQSLLVTLNVDRSVDALTLALQRLSDTASSQPMFNSVRAEIREEILHLQSLNLPNSVAIIKQLDHLSGELTKWSLAPVRSLSSTEPAETLWNYLPERMFSELKGLVEIRRDESGIEPVMPPDQSYFRYLHLRLRLDGARMALIRHQPEIFLNEIKQARQWTERYFDSGESDVKQGLTQLKKLENTQFYSADQLPDISRSLTLLQTLVFQASTVDATQWGTP